MHSIHYIPSHLFFSFFISTSLTFPVLTYGGLPVHYAALTVFPFAVIQDVRRLSALIDKLSPTAPAARCMCAFLFNVLDYDPSMYRLGLSTNTARLHGPIVIISNHSNPCLNTSWRLV